MNKTIGENIRERRKSLGIKQLELAQRLDISQDTMCRYERGYTQPGIYIMIEIASALECSIDYLVYGHDKITRRI